MKAFGPSFFLFLLISRYYQKFHENMGGNKKPQSPQRKTLCSKKEFPLEHISEQISPVLDRSEVYNEGRKKNTGLII